MMKKLIPIFIITLIFSYLFINQNQNKKILQSKKKLNISIPNKIKSFDPAVAFDDNSLSIMAQSLDTLYQYHYLKRPYEIIPSLAKGMPKINADSTVYTIKLKQNIRYHNHPSFNGPRFLKAMDIVNGIKRSVFKPLKSAGAWVFKDKIKGLKDFSEIVGEDYEKMLRFNVEGLKAIDDYTLEIKLNNPTPNLLYYLSMYFSSPIPEEIIKYTKNDLSKTLIGTGAYKLKKDSDKTYIFKRFEFYRKEKYPSVGDRYANYNDLLNSSQQRMPFLDEVEFHIIASEDEMWNMFMDNKLDLINVPKKYLNKIIKDVEFQNLKINKKFEVKYFSKLSTRWLGFNMQSKLIGKGEQAYYLRKAIAHAIDFESYLELLSGHTSLKANSILHPSIKGYNPSHKFSYNYNLNLAKKYLKKAGYPDGLGLPVLQFTTRGNSKAILDEANFFKNQLNKIGIKLEIEIKTFSEFLQLGRSGKLKHLWIDNWIYDYPETENIIQLLISSNYPGINKSGVKDENIDNIYKELLKTNRPSKRVELFYQVEKIVDEQIPWITLIYESSYMLQRKELKNFRKSYFIKNYIKYLKK